MASRNVRAGSRPAPGPGLVVGAVPVLARLAGVVLVLAGLTGLAPLVSELRYLTVGGTTLRLAGDLFDLLAALPLWLTHVVVGVVLLLGRIPRFGVAYAGVAGALAFGPLLIEVYRSRSSTDRPGVEVIAGETVLTSSVDVGPAWTLLVAALALTVLAGLLALLAWGRTVMDDEGSLDPARPVLAGTAALLGVATVLSLVLPAADVPDDLVRDPVTGFITVVDREGAQGLLERPGLALLGGLLLAGAVVLCSVVAPSLRPRLAVVGALLALTSSVLGAAVAGWWDAVTSDELSWTVAGIGLLLCGLGYLALTLLAWRLRPAPSLS